MERQWSSCLGLPAQCRYALVFARLCSHFSGALHDMCPEEKNHLTEKASILILNAGEVLIFQNNIFIFIIFNISVTVDITRLFNNALLQQTQPLDSRNRETVTAIYTKWYLEVVLRRSSTGHMVIVLAQRLPFLTASFNNLYDSTDEAGKAYTTNEVQFFEVYGFQ
uniref:BTB domain-containing protein n=1 Tax=Heterorhabditis bacteriophora TaxID=37862 RepID=A0A1I7XE33_HETBA